MQALWITALAIGCLCIGAIIGCLWQNSCTQPLVTELVRECSPEGLERVKNRLTDKTRRKIQEDYDYDETDEEAFD